MKLDITFCHRCGCTHDFGKHVQSNTGRGVLGRGVAASASDPATVGAIKRGDDVTVPSPAVQPASVTVQSPRPPHIPFDKNQWQADYMRDRRMLDRLGYGTKGQRHVTVTEYRHLRKHHGGMWETFIQYVEPETVA